MQRLQRSLGLTDFAGLTLLDFAAGRGAVADVLVAQGARVIAVEPFGHELLAARGIETYATLDDVPPDLRCDGIISIDTIEHLTAPLDTFTQLKSLLADDGWLFVATPNVAGVSGKFKRAKWREVLNPGHLFLFAPNNLELLLDKAGFPQRQRLRWYVRYTDDIVKRAVHTMLQTLAWDGELRYLAFNK